EDYAWSSAAFHLGLRNDKLLRSKTQWGEPVEDWRRELEDFQDEETVQLLRTRTQCGFPCGDEAFVRRLSQAVGRPLLLRGRGRPRKW
ncbi:MAG: hypothetical protein Q7T82_03755, partial [Armatimonadota bacterium]|nr:hypothetical protein [Armatimonadota bacterium]